MHTPCTSLAVIVYVCMATRATRSTCRTAARVALSERIRDAEAVATGPLGALSHDELGVIVDGLADPLQPDVAVALSSTCLGLRTPLRAALELLKERHERAVALCRKVGTSCAALRDAEELAWQAKGLTTDDMATLAMILRTNGLPRLMTRLTLDQNFLGDAGVQALCEALGHGAAPSLQELGLMLNNIGQVGTEAVAAALRRGAVPKLNTLLLAGNDIDDQGVAALAEPLRTLPALERLYLVGCGFGDEGVASLFVNLGKDDFKHLEVLWLSNNDISDVGMATLLTALNAGGLPELIDDELKLVNVPASTAAVQAVHDVLAKRLQ